MKTLLHLQSPMAGTITMGDGLKINEIGYLPQQTALQRDFPASVEEIVMSGFLGRMGLRPFYTKGREEGSQRTHGKNKNYRSGCSLLQRAFRRPAAESASYQSLMCYEKNLLLDEPVSGLDPVATADMYQIISELNKEDHVTIIMISHDIGEVANYAKPCASYRTEDFSLEQKRNI